MRKATLGSLLVSLVVLGIAQADPMISIGDVMLEPNRADQKWRVLVTNPGSDPPLISGMDFYVRIGSGEGLAGAPTISGVDILGTAADPAIFFGSSPDDIFWAETHPYWAGKSIDTSGEVTAGGLLATVTFDTTGVASGEWPLTLKDPGDAPTSFGTIEPAVLAGRLVVGTVPEPTGGSMLAVAGVMLIWRRFRHHRRV